MNVVTEYKPGSLEAAWPLFTPVKLDETMYLLMQDKFSQELSNERAALDWELQQRQADCGRQIRPSDVYNHFRLFLVVERFEVNHFLQHSR